MRSKISTKSGVIPISIYTPSFKCKIACVYCPQASGIPKSYLPNEDTLFAETVKYNSYQQVKNQLLKITSKGINSGKIELIVLGGTFTELPKNQQSEFIKSAVDALNGENSNNIEDTFLKNESANFRATIINVETRPDEISNKVVSFLIKIGVSKIEIGVQSIYNDILQLSNRPYTAQTIVNATQIIKKAGLKCGFHAMLNLPGSNPQLDKTMLKEIIHNSNYQPDFLKVYPLTLITNRQYQKVMWKLFDSKEWIKYSEDSIYALLKYVYLKAPRFMRIQRTQRKYDHHDEIYQNINFKVRISEDLNSNNIRMNDVSAHERLCFRLYKERSIKSDKVILKKEIISDQDVFIYAEESSRSCMVGFIRLRILNSDNVGSIIIREIKVFGRSKGFDIKKDLNGVQNFGVGKNLLKEAEILCAQLNCSGILAVCSPGVRGFFRKNGYHLDIDSGYMIKNRNE